MRKIFCQPIPGHRHLGIAVEARLRLWIEFVKGTFVKILLLQRFLLFYSISEGFQLGQKQLVQGQVGQIPL